MDAATVTALVSGATVGGGALKFVWDKMDAKFTDMQTKLDECERRHDIAMTRAAVKTTVIELLMQEFRNFRPKSDALQRALKLMDGLKQDQEVM